MTDKNTATKRILILASNPAVSEQTGWPIGFWLDEAAERRHLAVGSE